MYDIIWKKNYYLNFTHHLPFLLSKYWKKRELTFWNKLKIFNNIIITSYFQYLILYNNGNGVIYSFSTLIIAKHVFDYGHFIENGIMGCMIVYKANRIVIYLENELIKIKFIEYLYDLRLTWLLLSLSNGLFCCKQC